MISYILLAAIVVFCIFIVRSFYKIVKTEIEYNKLMDKCIEQNKRQSELLDKMNEALKKTSAENERLTNELGESYRTCESILDGYGSELAKLRTTFSELTEEIQLIAKE